MSEWPKKLYVPQPGNFRSMNDPKDSDSQSFVTDTIYWHDFGLGGWGTDDLHNHTISPLPNRAGWQNEMGAPLSGLPKAFAEEVVRRWNDYGAMLSRINRLLAHVPYEGTGKALHDEWAESAKEFDR